MDLVGGGSAEGTAGKGKPKASWSDTSSEEAKRGSPSISKSRNESHGVRHGFFASKVLRVLRGCLEQEKEGQLELLENIEKADNEEFQLRVIALVLKHAETLLGKANLGDGKFRHVPSTTF